MINLGAEPIKHGITAVHDQELLDHLKKQQITLDVCPTSNVALKVVENLDRHPIRELVAAGVPVTVNSDDPPMFGTDLNQEYAIAARLLNLGEHGVADLARAAVHASFASDATKSALLADIDHYLSDGG